MAETGEVRLPPPENSRFKPANALEARMLLAASNPTRIDELINPQNKNIGQFAKDDFKNLDEQDFTLFDNASTNERMKTSSVKREELETKVSEWAKTTAKYIRESDHKQGLVKLLGDPEKITDTTIVEFYSKYFSGNNKESDIKQFVKDLIHKYSYDEYTKQYIEGEINVIALNNDMQAIEWFAHVFGTNSAEVVTQLIDAEIRSQGAPNIDTTKQTDENNRGFSDYSTIGNQFINEIAQGSRDERLLRFLQQNRQAPQFADEPVKPVDTPPTEPLEPTPGTPQLEANKTYSIEEIFDMVKTPVNPHHQYFVNEPSTPIDLPEQPEKIRQLEMVEPFFIPHPTERGVTLTNPQVIPFVHELEVRNQRYRDAAELTSDDSGLLALAASSARTAEQQAVLYHALVDAVLEMHIHELLARPTDPNNPALLERWLKKQETYSRQVFEYFDKKVPDHSELRPDDEQLLTYDENGQFSEGEFRKLWEKRLLDLEHAKNEGKLTLNQIRQIEFLSHSVNVPELIKIVKSQQPEKVNQEESDFEIKILKPENKERVIEISEQELDQPTIIQIDRNQVPSQGDIDFKIIPYLEDLKLKDQFNTWQGFTDFQRNESFQILSKVELPGISNQDEKFSFRTLKKTNFDGTIQYATLLYRRDAHTNRDECVAHVDFVKLANSKEANCSVNQIDQITTAPNFRAIHDLENWKDSIEAVKIKPEYRGRGLGKSLWYLAMAQAQMEGIDKVNIIGDMTKGQRPDRPGESFYQNLGAEPILLIEELENDQVVSSQHLVSPTYFLPGQKRELDKIFSVN